jgi:hypothetical protein
VNRIDEVFLRENLQGHSLNLQREFWSMLELNIAEDEEVSIVRADGLGAWKERPCNGR